MNFMLSPLCAVAAAIRPVPTFCSSTVWCSLIQSSFMVVLITLITSLNINVCAWTRVHAFLVRISFIPVTGRPLAHSVRSLYAALKYDFSCMIMQSKHAVFRRQYQKPKELEPLLLQTWHAHIQHITAVHPSHQEAVDKQAWHRTSPFIDMCLSVQWVGTRNHIHINACALAHRA